MQTYIVGGAVRDELLGRPNADRDYVVVGATPEAMLAQGFRPVGKDFPVFLHPDTHEEYALARTERKTGRGYHGFTFHAAPDVTLDDDLARRDLTINAMAKAADGRLIDPFHGQRDLQAKVLRHVGPAFAEDPVRILRIARFAARFSDFSIAPETLELMRGMVAAGEVDHLVAERVWQELAKGLMEDKPSRMFEVLRDCGALARLLPEVDKLFGVPQRADYHPEIDTGIHTLMVVDQSALRGFALPVRFSALTHDLGKAETPADILPRHLGHEERSVRLTEKLCARLRVPNDCRDLALLMARTVTARRATITLDWGYHGNTNGLIDVSPYKFNRKGGRGKPDHVEIAELADPYRGRFKGYGANSGIAYAASVAEKVELIRAKTGEGPGAFIAEAISGCGGQVFFPDAYLRTAAEHVRKAGGLVIIDEVQTGFGRVGNHMWAHGPQGIIPDIVTLGKPIGNGHPMAAVVTTPEIARAFANGMEFFSSFGGNPVSAAVGMAVLDVLEQEYLQHKARITGEHLKARFQALAEEHSLIGHVRGEGLFLGVELVKDHTTLEPATEEAGRIANFMRDHGVLISTDGPFDNVLKIKPPMAFGLQEADIMADTLNAALKHM